MIWWESLIGQTSGIRPPITQPGPRCDAARQTGHFLQTQTRRPKVLSVSVGAEMEVPPRHVAMSLPQRPLRLLESAEFQRTGQRRHPAFRAPEQARIGPFG